MKGEGGPPGPGSARYEVHAYNPFHLSGETERYRVGEFAECEPAVAACRKLVDDFLAARYRPGMTADELFALYQEGGPEPFILSDDPDCLFRATGYARERAAEICGSRSSGTSV